MFLIKYINLWRRSDSWSAGRQGSSSTYDWCWLREIHMIQMSISREVFGWLVAENVFLKQNTECILQLLREGKTHSFNLHQLNEQIGRRRWEKVPGLKWWDVSVLVLKNVSVFVFDCVTAGMPRLQGLASSPLCYVCVCVAQPPPANSCKCSLFEKCVMSVLSLMIYSGLKSRFFHSPPSSSLLLSSNINFKHRETTVIWSHFLFCGRSFIAAKPTGRPLNSETQPDRCGRETPPAAMQVIHPQGTDRDELHRHIKSLESNFFYAAAC